MAIDEQPALDQALKDAEVLYQGAEGRLRRVTLLGMPALHKERFSKSYRHPELDARLNKTRITREVRAHARAIKAGVQAPSILYVDLATGSFVMELIEGRCLREVLELPEEPQEGKLAACGKLGAAIARLHNAGLSHGDLTTSNAMRRDADGELVLIDFGLAQSSANVEDKAVDVYVLERAFSSTHPGSEALFARTLEAYEAALADKDRAAVMAKFRQVQMRGRKREMVG